MKKLLLLIFLLCPVVSFSQGIVMRAGYSFSPEDGLLILPPIHLSMEYQFTSPNTGYIGVCTGGSIVIAAWGGIGLYYGYKLKSFFIENKFNWFLVSGEEYSGRKGTSQFSINPKIGFEKYHMYIKAGPYFGINEKQENLLNIQYLHIGHVIIDVEAGFYLNVNEDVTNIKRYRSGQFR